MALDLPGYGGSGHLAAGRYRLLQISLRVSRRPWRRLKIARPVLIGHSLGAQLTLKLAVGGLVRPGATILIDMSPEANDEVDAVVAGHIDALIAGAADLEGLIGLVQARLPLGQADAIREAVTAMARATAQGWQVPLDLAI